MSHAVSRTRIANRLCPLVVATVFYTFVSTTPVEFAVQEILLQGETEMKLPTAVAFGPDGKLYVGTHGGKLARFTLNDSYDTVVSYVVTNRFPNNKDMCILGIAFDPTETPELGDQISVYIALSEIYHGEYRNSYGQAVNGRIQVVRGANLDQVTNVVTGLPISEKDHALNGMHFGKFILESCRVWDSMKLRLTPMFLYFREQATTENSTLRLEATPMLDCQASSRDQSARQRATFRRPFWWSTWPGLGLMGSLSMMLI
jgi:hypothetical protein